MEFKAAQIAEWIEGKTIGNENEAVSSFANIEEAGEGALTFLGNPKYVNYLSSTAASVVIVSKSLNIDSAKGKTFIVVDDAYAAITKLLKMYDSMQGQKTGIEQPSFVHDTATLGENIYLGAFAYVGENVKIGKNCTIYPQAYIGDNVEIGDNTTIYSGVKIYKNCQVGNHCIVHAGTVLGSDGFGFQPDEKGVFRKVPQIGNVVIKDYVELGACCTIDRATMGSTIIEQGVKLDNQIQVAHNVVVGKNTVIAAQTGIAGSTKLGEQNMIGGQVGIAGHLKTGKGVQIQAQSGVNKDIRDGEQLYGSPAMDAMNYRKSYVHFKNLPNLVKQLNNLNKKINTEKK